MNALVQASALPIMDASTIERVRKFEKVNLAREQTPITTFHLFHAGMYARTITIPAGVLLTGVLIKRATVLILNGDAMVYVGDDGFNRLVGYHVIPASAHRKQVFFANLDTQLTMIFPTAADTALDAEDEFTDESDLLFSRHGKNVVNITEAKPCQAAHLQQQF